MAKKAGGHCTLDLNQETSNIDPKANMTVCPKCEDGWLYDADGSGDPALCGECQGTGIVGGVQLSEQELEVVAILVRHLTRLEQDDMRGVMLKTNAVLCLKTPYRDMAELSKKLERACERACFLRSELREKK